ncbi:hypothetical protein AHAS_Ahas19G0124600 [Arachis hypogaea]
MAMTTMGLNKSNLLYRFMGSIEDDKYLREIPSSALSLDNCCFPHSASAPPFLRSKVVKTDSNRLVEPRTDRNSGLNQCQNRKIRKLPLDRQIGREPVGRTEP